MSSPASSAAAECWLAAEAAEAAAERAAAAGAVARTARALVARPARTDARIADDAHAAHGGDPSRDGDLLCGRLTAAGHAERGRDLLVGLHVFFGDVQLCEL